MVDDDESYRAILRHHLETLGYEVLEARDGAEACQIASMKPLQLMILDIVMPNSEGLGTSPVCGMQASALRSWRFPVQRKPLNT